MQQTYHDNELFQDFMLCHREKYISACLPELVHKVCCYACS